PPTPTIAALGNAFLHSTMARTATGRSAGPDSPPPPAPRTARRVLGSTTMARIVFTNVSPSAPAPRAAPAISQTSGTLGLSLAHRGSPHSDAATASAVAAGWWANMRD